MEYDAVIFDKDGTLLDSSIDGFRWLERAKVEKARELGYDVSLEEAHEIILLDSVKETEEYLREEEMTWDDLAEIMKAVSEEKIRRIRRGDIGLCSGVEKVLKSLELPKSIVSNASRNSTRFTVEFFDLSVHFEDVRAPKVQDMRNFVNVKKPHPEMVHRSMEVMGAENPVMVGDSGSDVGAARNAGIDSVIVDREYNRNLEPDHRIESLDELLQFFS